MADTRNDIVDAFRGVAILAVIVFHYSVRWPNLYGYERELPNWLELGKYGVHVFFVISGLVITMTVQRSASALDFAVNRFVRLYPAFIVAATLTFACTSLLGPDVFQITPLDYVANFTMVPSNLGRAPADGAYWSLAVELKFYFFVAIFFKLLKQRFWAGLIGIAAISIPISLLSPTIAERIFIVDYWAYFLAGMAGSYALQKRGRTASILAGASLAHFVFNQSAWQEGLVTGSCVAVFMTLLFTRPGMKFGAMSSLGRVSYSLYLIHQRMGVMLIATITPFAPDWLAVAFTLCAVIAAATLMHRVIELPAQRALRRWWRTRCPPIGSAPEERGGRAGALEALAPGDSLAIHVEGRKVGP